ncbi:MAG: OadG family transporter subunit [Candidatus Bipolaricaulota bacterium]|nr:OadG family transporter subunit [Candidatus Bipolaricaulota bacterium]MDW8140677.1 OadG family transporter subunit [Candidatus Bipolaricaulota bacterium]
MIAALGIALLGMGMVFAVLGVLLAAMVLVEKLTQSKGEAPDESQ